MSFTSLQNFEKYEMKSSGLEFKTASSKSLLDRFFDQEKAYNFLSYFLGNSCCSLEIDTHQGSPSAFFENHTQDQKVDSINSDVLFVSGIINFRNVDEVKRIYTSMPAKKWVVAIGGCAINGGYFAESYGVVNDIHKIFPVDIIIPGCPPTPESIDSGITLLKKRILRKECACD
tara:strand:+ start:192418 stop:192939 length:522 start_codon:yes stop_codon:yes gene_type:complete